MKFFQWLRKGGTFEDGWVLPCIVQILIGSIIGSAIVMVPTYLFLIRHK